MKRLLNGMKYRFILLTRWRNLKRIQQNGSPINSQQAVPSQVAQCIGLMILHREVAECLNQGNSTTEIHKTIGHL